VAFRNFKALRSASVRLAPFNLVIGPNGSGKTSLIEALLHLRTLSKLAPTDGDGHDEQRPDILFEFSPPHAGVRVRLSCIDSEMCDALRISPANAPEWPALRNDIGRIRSYVFDHAAMSQPSVASNSTELSADGANLAAVIAALKTSEPDTYAAFVGEALRLFPEFSAFKIQSRPGGAVALAFTLIGEVGLVDGENLSQGMLHTLGVLALAAQPTPPSVLCIEEIDRGVHPRMLREVRDALYRLAYPGSFGLARPPVQVIATTHSPYLLDLFRDHPEEVIVTQKHGREAHFERLSDRADLAEILQEGTLGDLWFSGILGGVPEEKS
ncbi:MAG TPA: ATP-binding protein, partial [Opitutus sp.]|nr:ATP-binding protein [Opitutus sp.]